MFHQNSGEIQEDTNVNQIVSHVAWTKQKKFPLEF